MINKDRWIDSLPKFTSKFDQQANTLDHNVWTNTISKKRRYNSYTKYSLIGILFISGLLFVSTVKNGTRNLQKEITSLEKSINVLKYNLQESILDNEVLTSPENISQLAKEYLNNNFVPYKKSQISHIDGEQKITNDRTVIKKEKIYNEKSKSLSKKLKYQATIQFKKKKSEIKKIRKFYSDPKSIPVAVKTKVVRKVEEKKIQLNNIYNSPKDTFTLERVQRWGAIQVVKVFLGIPVVPGR